MSLQRQYNLPHCKIILEGLSSDGTGVMDVLMTAECHITETEQVLTGGKVFWENLVNAVNSYAQECLSGLRHPLVTENAEEMVVLTKDHDKVTHQLVWQPQQDEQSQEAKSLIKVELNTVQLFDLIEAIDQFFADTTTLPAIKQNIEPLSRRYRRPDEPLVQRATPPLLGLLTVGVAAAFAFFFMPVPEPKPVQSTNQEKTTETPPKTSDTPLKPVLPENSQPQSDNK